jgi:delta1-piperideine-2-carboxylate reductase
MTTTSLTLNEIYTLAKSTLLHNGCDEMNAEAVSDTVTFAERDGSVSHGLFRIPGYTAALRSKKVKGDAYPSKIHIILQLYGMKQKH